jgi:hypothetical protein
MREISILSDYGQSNSDVKFNSVRSISVHKRNASTYVIKPTNTEV